MDSSELYQDIIGEDTLSLAEQVGLDTPVRREQVAAAFAQMEEHSVRYLRVACPDLMGVPRGKTVGTNQLERVFSHGCNFGARILLTDLREGLHSSVQLGEVYDYGNCYLLPDPASFFLLPWCPEHAVVLADPYLPNGLPAVSSRFALERAIDEASRIGLHVVVGAEIETYIYPLDDAPNISSVEHFYATLGQGLASTVLSPLLQAIEAVGIRLQTFENEHGVGQIEFNLGARPALEAIDQATFFRLAAKEILHASGYGITFMAKLHNGPDGMTSGLHIHQSGFDEHGESVFYDPEAPFGLSETFLWFLGGQLAAAPQIAALSTPTITGYKRYHPGTWAPTSATWSLDNRTSMLRVMPRRGPGTRVENRLPEAAANMYLALAAMLVAGVDGIRRQLDPGSPVKGDASTSDAVIPRSIRAAAECLRQPHPVTEFLGEDLITAYRGNLLRTADRFETYVTDWEINEYRAIL
jgi:glutamine synthetase